MSKEIRLLDNKLEDKIAINQFISETIIRWCAECDSGIDADKKPIYYSQDQKDKIDSMYKKSHGYCINCLKTIYKNKFNLDY